VINIFRYGKCDAAASAVKWGTFATTASALYLAPFSLLFKAGLAIGAYDVNVAILEKAGLNDEHTKSMLLLMTFQETLDSILRNLRHALAPELPAALPAALPRLPARHRAEESNSDAEDEDQDEDQS